MKAVAFIAKTPNLPVEHGAYNGYVAVPPTNKYHGKSYDDIEDVSVHGGLTYSEPVTLREISFGSGLKINSKYVGEQNPILDYAEFITDKQEIGNDWWIFGFDTCQLGDNAEIWDRDAVIEETMELMEQLTKKIIMNNFEGKKVIVRGDRSGVFFGTLAAKEGQEVKLEKCRRLWYWDGAASISQLAKYGTAKPGNCKFSVTVDEIELLDAIEIIPCTEKSIKSIESVDVWKV